MIASPETIPVEAEPLLETPIKPEPASRSRPTEQTGQDGVDETLYLIGRPTLKDFLRYVRNHAINPPSEGILTDEWEAAEELVRTLEKEEAGVADNPPIRKIEPEDEPLLMEFLNDPLVRHSFNTVPSEVAW